MTELIRALGVLAEPPGVEARRLAALVHLPEPRPADWTELFVLELVPYASVYLDASGMIGGEARDRVAGFWRALGLVPPAEPDHLSSLLGFYAALEQAGRPEREALLAEHLESWLPVYLDRVDELASPAYRAWGRLLREALAAERELLGSQARISLHLRTAPPLERPEDVGLDAFLAQLLAPARSGLVLARADLAHAARDLGLGLRLGERRFALRALVEQDAAGTLRWLATLARRRGERATGFWQERAAAAAALLGALACEAEAAADPVGVC